MFASLAPIAEKAASTSQVEVSAAIIIAVIVIVIARQFQARRVRPLSYLLVLVLLVVGFQPPGPAEKTAEGIGVLVFGLFISAGFGIARGLTIPAWTDEHGRTWTKGNRTTLWLWIATILTRLVVGGFAAIAFHQPINVGALWLGFATTLAAQLIVVRLRGSRRCRRSPLSASRLPAGPPVVAPGDCGQLCAHPGDRGQLCAQNRAAASFATDGGPHHDHHTEPIACCSG